MIITTKHKVVLHVFYHKPKFLGKNLSFDHQSLPLLSQKLFETDSVSAANTGRLSEPKI